MKTESCIIKCSPKVNLAEGYTRVKVFPENYSKIIMIAGMTGKTIQDVVDELLTFALGKTAIMQINGVLTNLNMGNLGGDR